MDEIRFSRFAVRDPGALAIVDAEEKLWTRRALAALVNRLSRALRAAELQPGDSLAVLAPNCAEYLVAYLAATQLGLYLVPVNWHLAPQEIRYILEDCDGRVLIAHQNFGPMIRGVIDQMPHPPRLQVSIGSIEGFISLEHFVAGQSPAPLTDAIVGRMLAYTSATTGRPKGVMLPIEEAAQALDASIERRIAAGTMPEAHVQLCASMLYHGAPLEHSAASLHMGHVVVLMAASAPEAVLRLIDQYRVTVAYMVPTLFNRLLGLDESVRRRYSLATLRRVLHTGAPCPVEVKHRMIEWLGPILWELYGATEGSGTVVSAQDWLRYPGTVGRPFEGTRLKILDDTGSELPPGSVGTIYMTRFAGDRFHYRGDPEKTRACHRGDFFTVGDVGYVNEQGFLFISDRKIDMIIRSGMKVYPKEIENALARHPKIADCAVFGVPDERSGEAIIAAIQLVPDLVETHLPSAEILRFLGESLSLAKLPQKIIYTRELPRDPTGKLKKRDLREQFLKIA